eukprot:g8670.t1 g8670   contig30:5647-7020(+)
MIVFEEESSSAIEMKSLFPNGDGGIDILDSGNLLCVQSNSRIGAIFHEGSILNASDYKVYKDWLSKASSSPSLPLQFRVVDRKEVIMSYRYLPESREINANRNYGGNVGNYIWEYGATNLLNPFTTRLVESKDWKTSVFIVAQANLFLVNGEKPNLEQMMFNQANAIRERVVNYDLPTIMLGIGVQIEFGVAENVTFDERYASYHQLLHEVGTRHKSKSIAVRGDITENFCRNSGFHQCISLGCPSLTINRDLNLGATLKAKWNKVLESLREVNAARKIKVALTLPAIQMKTNYDDYKMFVDVLLSLYRQHDSYFIMQSDYDEYQLKEYTKGEVDESRMLTFKHSVEPWFDFISKVDVVVSTRIHGGMAGIAKGVPAVIIPTDFRILELVEAMKLPALAVDTIEKERHSSLINIMEDAPFDHVAFEANRRQKIKEYKRILEDVGLEIDPSLSAIVKQ